MKKIKIMLFAIVVAAIASGALAFKISKKYSVSYCSSPTVVGTCDAGSVDLPELLCPGYVQNSTTTHSPQFPFVCTITPNAGGPLSKKCITTNFFGIENYKPCIITTSVRLKAE